ncbi:MAG: hypothetical protein KFKLKKLM_02681 [Flavobacteriales bacterium]|nr:hypothetical protein [Flavobacteriales bacterium]
MKTTIAPIFILLMTCMTSCFDTIESEQLVGPYFVLAIDLPENMCIVYNEKEDHSGGGHVVSPTVYEIEWNDNFIVAKQHPKDDIESIVLNDYREHAFDSLKKSGQMEHIHSISDSLSKVKFAVNKQAGLYEKLKGKTKRDITIFYLIDTRERSPYSTLFLSKHELDSALIELNVGRLDKRKYYDYLDKR